MSSQAKQEEVPVLLGELLEKYGLKPGTSTFEEAYRKSLGLIEGSRNGGDFVDKKTLDDTIDGLLEKFAFHGYVPQSDALKRCYDTYINSPEGDTSTRLNVVKLLLALSVSPTNNMSTEAAGGVDLNETVTDWGAYLKEGIPRWLPIHQDDTSGSDYESLEIDSSNEGGDNKPLPIRPSLMTLSSEQTSISGRNYTKSRQDLIDHIQNGWYNEENVRMMPASRWFDANVQLHWENYVSELTHGLIQVEAGGIISEYKVMREVLWQLWGPHKSFVFDFDHDTLIVRPNVTIASVRTNVFTSFMRCFLKYINVLEVFRQFCKKVRECFHDFSIPGTYGSYSDAIEQILKPVYTRLIKIEDEVREQESIWTLISLDHELDHLFRPVFLLKGIHDSVILDYKNNTTRVCSKTLLNRLYKGLRAYFCLDEQILYIVLYLQSLAKYFQVLESWFYRGIFEDLNDEFPIRQTENPKSVMDCFEIHQDYLDTEDPITKIMCGSILQIGKNLHLLRLLQKWRLLTDEKSKHKNSLYDEFISKVIKKMADYFNKKIEESDEEEEEDGGDGERENFVFPATCPDFCKHATERDRLETLVDTSNVFLMAAFEPLLTEEPVKKTKEKPSLYETTRNIVDSTFPVHEMLAGTLMEILKSRYFNYGDLVKDIFIEELRVTRHFGLLEHLFLMKDDLIGPLYRSLFQKLENGDNIGADIWLTSQLQDILMDTYPDLYDRCSVDIGQKCDYYSIQPVFALSKLKIQYETKWPLNIIVQDDDIEMYTRLFRFLIKLKWASFILDRLQKNDFRNEHFKRVRLNLNRVRFGLIHLVNNIQQYVFGYIFGKYTKKFEEDLANSYDIETLIASHKDFIKGIHDECVDFENSDEVHGFTFMLSVVKRMRQVWKDPQQADLIELKILRDSYAILYKNIDPMSNPAFFVI